MVIRMKKLNDLDQIELMRIEGGVIDWVLIGGIAAVATVYGVVRNAVYDAGKANAYDELGR